MNCRILFHYHNEMWTKWPPFCRHCLSIDFHERKFCSFDYILPQFVHNSLFNNKSSLVWVPKLYPNQCWLITTAHTVLGGFFPYLAQMITIMRGCVTCNDLWPWPISLKTFSHNFAKHAVYDFEYFQGLSFGLFEYSSIKFCCGHMFQLYWKNWEVSIAMWPTRF